LLDMGGGQAWVFGGVVLISQPGGLPGIERDLTAEEMVLLNQQLAAAEGTIAVNATARLRGGPGTTFSQVGIVPFGGRVFIIGRNPFSTWFYVNYNGSEGWISIYLLATPNGYDAQAVPIIQ